MAPPHIAVNKRAVDEEPEEMCDENCAERRLKCGGDCAPNVDRVYDRRRLKRQRDEGDAERRSSHVNAAKAMLSTVARSHEYVCVELKI